MVWSLIRPSVGPIDKCAQAAGMPYQVCHPQAPFVTYLSSRNVFFPCHGVKRGKRKLLEKKKPPLGQTHVRVIRDCGKARGAERNYHSMFEAESHLLMQLPVLLCFAFFLVVIGYRRSSESPRERVTTSEMESVA